MPRNNVTNSQRTRRSKKVRNSRNSILTPSRMVVVRDPLESENSVNLGDLQVLPPLFRQPRLTNQIYRIARLVNSPDATQGLALNAFSTVFTLADLPNFTEFTALFDMYRIFAVQMRLRPRFNLGTVGSITTVKLPRLFSVIDYNDNVNLTLINDALEYQSCKETRFDQDHVRMIRPHANLAAQEATLVNFGGLKSQVSPWLSTEVTDVNHYGLKFLIEAGAAGQTVFQSWSVDLTYYLEFKQTL